MTMDLLAGYLTARVGAIAALVLALLLGCGLVFEHCRLAEARAGREICERHAEHLQRQVGAAQAQLGAFQAAVKEQNRQVERLRAETEEQRVRVEAAERRVGETRVEYRDRVRRVLIAPVPSECDAAVRWGAQHAREAAKAWREGR